MFLNNQQIQYSNDLRKLILNIVKNEDENYTCKKCHGTGLNAVKCKNNYIWDGVSYCNDCKGIGFIFKNEIEELSNKGIYVCNFCNGIGCEKCNNSGFFDWIENVTKVKNKDNHSNVIGYLKRMFLNIGEL